MDTAGFVAALDGVRGAYGGEVPFSSGKRRRPVIGWYPGYLPGGGPQARDHFG